MVADIYSCNLDAEANCRLKIYLFRNVQNVDVVRKYVMEGAWKCAIVKPSLILDPFQIVVAANKAVVSRKTSSMVTKTIYTEILYNLSLSKNISQSLSKFGIEKGQDLLICFIVDSEDDYSKDIIPQIEGDMEPLEVLQQIHDLKQIKSIYKLNENNFVDYEDMLDIIVTKIATKHFVSH